MTYLKDSGFELRLWAFETISLGKLNGPFRAPVAGCVPTPDSHASPALTYMGS